MWKPRFVSIVLLLALLTAVPAPSIAASAGAESRRSGVAPSLPAFTPPDPGVHLLSSSERGASFVIDVPWEDLQVDATTTEGQTYARIALPGWASSADPGKPALPVLAQAIGAPFGVDVAVAVTPGPSHTIALPAPVQPAATQRVVSQSPAARQAKAAAASLPRPELVVVEDPAVYAVAAAYPAALAAITSDGQLRRQRVAGITVYPAQYNPAERTLTVYESLTIEVTFAPTSFIPHLSSLSLPPSADSPVFEQMLRGALLNYEAARAWRAAFTPGSSGAASTSPAAAGEGSVGVAALPWAPPDPGWRIKVREDGFYKLTFTVLQDSGVLAAGPDPRTFRLYNLGREVAIYVAGEDDGSFDSADYILFYGQALSSKYTADNVYWLAAGGALGQRMSVRDGAPGAALISDHHEATLHLEENKNYVSDLPGDENLERRLWDWIQPPDKASWSTSFSLAAPWDGSYTARLQLRMYGALNFAANPDHHTRIYVNGLLVEDAKWNGMVWRTADVTFPQNLVAGVNTLEVVCPNDLGLGIDAVYVDWAEITYADTFSAAGDASAFAARTSAATRYEVAGFTGPAVAVYDVTNPAAAVRLANASVTPAGATPAGATYTAAFQDTAGAGTRYWALEDGAYRLAQAIATNPTAEPPSIEADAPSDLASTVNGADWIAITPEVFAAEAAALRDHRLAQGLRAQVVDVQDIYDEFGYGITDVDAIHDFLAYTNSQWLAPAPSYVVLVGDGNYDPKNLEGHGRRSFIPPYLAPVDNNIGETAADNRYVTVSGNDSLPDMMLGRLSVNSVAEASTLVNKIISYENSPVPGGWQQQVLAIADNQDGAGNFPNMSNSLVADYLSAPYTAEKVHYGVTHTTTPAAKAAILAGINAGKLIVNYIGHAAIDLWADEGLFGTSDVKDLANGSKLPVVLPMTCWEGYFIYPYPLDWAVESVAEVITNVAGKGAVASWSATGLGNAAGHDYLDRGFFKAIFTNGAGTIGAGTATGKLALFASGSNLDLLDTYLLFGDPATRMPAACAAPAAAANDVAISRLSDTEVQLGWSAAGGALLYQVWWKGNDFYFTPGAACTEANGCTWRSAPSFTHAGGLENTAVNNSYVVLPVSACGAVQSTLSNRTAEFDFSLTPGN